MNKRFMLAACAALTMTVSGPANAAVTVNYTPNPANTSALIDATSGPGSFTLNFNGFTGNNGPTIPGLTSSILFNFLGTTGNSYNFSYTLSNTSSAPIDASRVTIFGFNSDPNVVSASVGGGNQFNVISSGNQPNGLAALELCFKDAGPANNCTGANQGLANGGSTSGTFSLTYASALNSITLQNFSVRYQGIDSRSLQIAGGSASGLPTQLVGVPEPEVWGMMLFGMGLVGSAMRRRRSVFVTA
jgi:PEP-CTERM motif